MKVKITGNLSRYEQKSVGIFTAKQLLYSLIGLVAGVGVYILINPIIPMVFATFISAILGISIASCGFLKFGGIPVSNVVCRLIKYACGKSKYKYITEAYYVPEEEKPRRNQR